MYNSVNNWSEFSAESWNNVIGTCGVRPLGIGPKGKAKLAAWQACRAQKKEGGVTDPNLDTSFLDPYLNKPGGGNTNRGDQAPPPPSDPPSYPAEGTGLPMMAWVGIGGAGLALIGLGAYFIFRKKKA